MRNPKVVLFSVLLIFLASACASSQPITEPDAVIEAFYEALNDLDLDAAMSFVAEGAEFIITLTYSGKSEIRGVFQQGVDESWQWEIIDIQADGDKVSWTDLLTIGAGMYENSHQAVVQEGLIISLTMDV